jgi:hypothetical protein
MSYSIERALLVSNQIEKISTYNAHQLAGQFANLEFWIAEAMGALSVVDEYPSRFAQMRDAQNHWVNSHGTLVSAHCAHCGGACEFGPMPPPALQRIPSSEIERVRKAIRESVYALARRLYRAKWINESRFQSICLQVGTSVDLDDL